MCDSTYVCRASDGLVLAEAWSGQSGGSTDDVLKKHAKEISKSLHRISSPGVIEDKRNSFCYIIDDGVAYMTVCPSNYPRKLAFAFLHDIQRAFVEELKITFGTHSMEYRSIIQTIEKPYYFIKFDRIIQRKWHEYKNPNSATALEKLNESLTEVSDIMRSNITDILERGTKIDEISNKTRNLISSTDKFHRVSKWLAFQAVAQKYAPWALLLVIIVIICVLRLVL